MLVNADLSDIVERTPIPAGTYQARVTDVEQKESRAGKPYLNWKAELMGEGVIGRLVYHSTPITGKGAFRLQELYTAATGEVLDKENPSFDTEQVIGKEIMMTLVDAVDQNGEARSFPEVKTVKAAQ